MRDPSLRSDRGTGAFRVMLHGTGILHENEKPRRSREKGRIRSSRMDGTRRQNKWQDLISHSMNYYFACSGEGPEI